MFQSGRAIFFVGKAVLTSFSSVIRSKILWTVFARTRSKSSYTHGRKLSKNLKKRMIQTLKRSMAKDIGHEKSEVKGGFQNVNLEKNIEIQLDKL